MQKQQLYAWSTAHFEYDDSDKVKSLFSNFFFHDIKTEKSIEINKLNYFNFGELSILEKYAF